MKWTVRGQTSALPSFLSHCQTTARQPGADWPHRLLPPASPLLPYASIFALVLLPSKVSSYHCMLKTKGLHHPQIHMLKPNPWCERIGGGNLGKRSAHKDRALRNGVDILKKRDPRALSCAFCHVRIQWEDSCLWIRKWVFTRHQICRCHDLGLLSLQNCENKWWLLVGHPVCGRLLQQPQCTKYDTLFLILPM